MKPSPKQIFIENNIFEDCMYNKKDVIFEDDVDIFILNNKETEKQKEKNIIVDTNKINKLDFPY
jgi:hypothetical protein